MRKVLHLPRTPSFLLHFTAHTLFLMSFRWWHAFGEPAKQIKRMNEFIQQTRLL